MPKPAKEVAAPEVAASPAVPSQPTLKLRIAIGRFSNATMYGKALLLDGDRDPLASQAADMLTARLVSTGIFTVVERSDLDAVKREQSIGDGSGDDLVGADTLVVGSVTEFGRKVEGQSGFLNSRMRQVATATVEVRLVDVRTGVAYFSTTGHGLAQVQAGEVAGFGSSAGYDSTLNDKAISAAISDLVDNVVEKLRARPWFTDVLQIRGDQILISGGLSQGLRVGDQFRLEVRGDVVKSGQTGLPISLPGASVGTIEIESFFGDPSTGEGAVARLLDGRLPTTNVRSLIVLEKH